MCWYPRLFRGAKWDLRAEEGKEAPWCLWRGGTSQPPPVVSPACWGVSYIALGDLCCHGESLHEPYRAGRALSSTICFFRPSTELPNHPSVEKMLEEPS